MGTNQIDYYRVKTDWHGPVPTWGFENIFDVFYASSYYITTANDYCDVNTTKIDGK